jgi:hypothetical protein
MQSKTIKIKELSREIGNCFGQFFEENNQFCIDNGEEIFRCDTEKELLTDWVDTLIEQHIDNNGKDGANWDKEVEFIYENVIGAFPRGIRPYRGKTKTTWKAEVFINDGTRHGKMVYLGGFPSIIKAIHTLRTHRGELALSK